MKNPPSQNLGFLLFAAATIGFTSFFYINTRTYDTDQHNDVLAHLQTLQVTDQNIDSDILRIRASSTNNYDDINKNLVQFLETLKETAQLIPEGETSSQHLIKIKSLINQKEALVEDIKSENAELLNSMHYLPLSVELMQGEPVDKLTEHLAYLLLLASEESATPSLKNEIDDVIAHLKTKRREISPAKRLAFDSLMGHAQVVLENKLMLSNYQEQIFSIPISQTLQTLADNYSNHHEQSVRRASIFRGLLVGFTAIMLAFLGFTLWRLKELLQKNKETSTNLQFQKFALDQHAIVSTTDALGTITYANDKFCALSGYSGEELIGQNHKLLKSGLMEEEVYRSLWRNISRGKVWEGNLCNKNRNGELYWIHSTIVPFLDDDGLPWQFINISTDITAMHDAEAEIEKSRQFLQRITDAMGEGVYALDNEGLLTFMNREAEIMLGWTQTELLGKRMHDVIHSVRPDGSLISFENCPISLAMRNTGIYRSNEEFFINRQGDIFPVAMVSSLLNTEEGTIGSVAVFRDIREETDLQNALKNARDEALEASRLKSEFLSTMSHEIRTPMNGVIGMADLLLDTPLDNQQLEFAGIIKDSANSLLGIINDILDFSKIEAGKLEIDPTDFAIRPVVEGGLELLASKAREKRLLLSSSIDPAIPDYVVGDAGRIRQILINLISNAIKFSAAGEVSVRCTLKDQTENTLLVRFEVQDYGIGMSQETTAKLFQPFTQADGSVSRKYGGTGLGLSICRRLVELMDGNIGVESELGKGSNFWFEIPFSASQQVSDHHMAREFSGLGMLVIVASEAQKMSLRNQLEYWGVSVFTAPHFEEAAALVKNELSIEAVIIDEDLANLQDSQEKQLGASNFPNLKKILLSNQSYSKSEVIDLGYDAALLRPVRQSALFDALMLVFERRKEDRPVTTERRQMADKLPIVKPQNEAHHRILLVEDNIVNQKVAIRMLNKLGYSADVAEHGQEALEALKKTAYALILMDCQMPVMDGFETTENIRKLEDSTNRNIPIIAMTANAMLGDEQRCLAAGMDDYLTKPINAKELEQKIKNWLTLNSSASLSPNSVDASESKLIDMDRLRDLFGNENDVIRELLTVFFSTTRPLLDKLELGIAEKSFDEIKKIGHQIGGSAGNLGMTTLHELGKRAEQAAANQDIEQSSAIHAAMVECLTQLQQFIQENV